MKTYTDLLGYTAKISEFKAIPLVSESSTNAFINAMSNKTYTENGALTNISTQNALVDWFFHGAALRRETDKSRILNLFVNAFNYDKTLALRTLFYIRDVRGGQGERKVFRICLEYLGNVEKDWVCKNLNLIAEYGRYDDYMPLLLTACRDEVIDYIGMQLEKDLQHHFKGELYDISLLAKWLPRTSVKNAEKRKWLNILLKSGKFGAIGAYRRALVLLRKDLDIVETKLVNKEYDKINYENLPSYAAFKYRRAFFKNDSDKYNAYIEAVKEGKAKINAKTLYPYDLIRVYSDAYDFIGYSNHIDINPTVEAQWKALPDYVPEINGLVVCDTSGSMNGLPMAVSLSLAIYIAERNKSLVWRNYVIPFSCKAQWKIVKGNTLLHKIRSIFTGDCSNTDLQSVFDLILKRAVTEKVPDTDMPKQLIIISDMEFDEYSFGLTNYEGIKAKYEKAGYTLPKLIWWNVDSRSNQTPITVNDKNNILLSGCSPSVMKIALGEDYDALEATLKVINQERYMQIVY
jgi:hypothetical protein